MDKNQLYKKLDSIYKDISYLMNINIIRNNAYASTLFNKWYPTKKSFLDMMSTPSNDIMRIRFLGSSYNVRISYRDRKNNEDKKAVKMIQPVISSLIKKEEETIKEIIYESQLIPASSNLDTVKWKQYITPRVILAMTDEDIRWFTKSRRQIILVCDCYLDRNDPLVIFFENEQIVHCGQLSDIKIGY